MPLNGNMARALPCKHRNAGAEVCGEGRCAEAAHATARKRLVSWRRFARAPPGVRPTAGFGLQVWRERVVLPLGRSFFALSPGASRATCGPSSGGHVSPPNTCFTTAAASEVRMGVYAGDAAEASGSVQELLRWRPPALAWPSPSRRCFCANRLPPRAWSRRRRWSVGPTTRPGTDEHASLWM